MPKIPLGIFILYYCFMGYFYTTLNPKKLTSPVAVQTGGLIIKRSGRRLQLRNLTLHLNTRPKGHKKSQDNCPKFRMEEDVEEVVEKLISMDNCFNKATWNLCLGLPNKKDIVTSSLTR